jgi:hypothetical protein
MKDTRFAHLKDIPSAHLLGAGTAMCAGCGGLLAVREIHEVLGDRTVFVNAAGCMTLLSTYPFTPFSGSFLYTAMASAPAGAQGVRDALDVLARKGRLAPEDDLSVVVLTGDGSASGMGLSATSAAIDRGLDFLYVCYDNEGYATRASRRRRRPLSAPGPPTTERGSVASKIDHLRDLGREPTRLRRDRDRQRASRPRPKGGEGREDPRPEAAARAGALPDGLGLRVGPAGRDRAPRREDGAWPLKEVEGRQDRSTPRSRQACPGRGVPSGPRPLRAPVRALA